MSTVYYDKQFVALFGEPIASEYNNALALMDVHADASLMMFRKVLESLCLKLAKNYHYKLKNTDLCEQINELSDETFINGITKELFHKVRQQTNIGVHQSEKLISKENVKSVDITTHNKRLEAKAIEVRKEMLNILELISMELKIVKQIPKYDLFPTGGQAIKDLIYTCLNSKDHKNHLSLGLTYQHFAKERENITLCDEGRAKDPNPYYIFAGEYFKSAFYFSTGLRISDIKIKKEQSHKINTNGYEPLFHYVMLSMAKKIDEFNSDEEELILRALVKRKYSEAYAQLGWKRYLAGYYKEGRKLIIHVNAKKNNFNLHKQGLIYLEGKACAVDINLSLRCFLAASKLSCADSLFELGKIYHRGEYVDVDLELAREYLNQAINVGSERAFNYMKENFIAPLEVVTSLIGCLSKKANLEIAKCKLKPHWSQTKKESE